MEQCNHKPISKRKDIAPEPHYAHYPHMTRCRYCGQRITPRKKWSYTFALLVVRFTMGVSLAVVTFGRVEDSTPTVVVASVIFFMSVFALVNIGFFISWRCVPDSEIENLPEPDPQVREEALGDLGKRRFRG